MTHPADESTNPKITVLLFSLNSVFLNKNYQINEYIYGRLKIKYFFFNRVNEKKNS